MSFDDLFQEDRANKMLQLTHSCLRGCLRRQLRSALFVIGEGGGKRGRVVNCYRTRKASGCGGCVAKIRCESWSCT
jgi:hypothetical protein